MEFILVEKNMPYWGFLSDEAESWFNTDEHPILSRGEYQSVRLRLDDMMDISKLAKDNGYEVEFDILRKILFFIKQ